MKEYIYRISIIVCVIFSIVAIVLHFFPYDSKPTANDIYNSCLYNVVEVKADSKNVGESFGTGEIISPDGKIITNAHVVTYTRLSVLNEFENIYIRFSYEEDYRKVTLERYDAELDLALLQISDDTGLKIKPISLGDSSKIQSGDNVYAIGNASNYGIGVFDGIVSIPLITVELDGVKRNVIQCDLTVSAGNSGGALLNERGELIGITTFRTKDLSGNIIYGLVYCIPIDIILEFLMS